MFSYSVHLPSSSCKPAIVPYVQHGKLIFEDATTKRSVIINGLEEVTVHNKNSSIPLPPGDNPIAVNKYYYYYKCKYLFNDAVSCRVNLNPK
jgi:hypothetical protein